MRVWAENLWKVCGSAREVSTAQLELLLGEHDDRAALGRLVGQRGELRHVGQLALGDARRRMELRRLPVAERDRAGLVEQQHVHVACGFDRPTRGRDDVGADHAVHARDADGGEQSADRGRDQADQQCDQHRDR